MIKNEDVRILIVDDDEEYCRLLAGQLSSWGFSPRYISDARECMNEFVVYRPHIVLLDVRLPHKDSLELLRSMLTSNPHVAVVMISAYVDQQVAKKAIALGACDYIPKPTGGEELRRAIQWQVTGIEQES